MTPERKKILLNLGGAVVLAALCSIPLVPIVGLILLSASHVEANAPRASDFAGILQRDLTAYFASTGIEEPNVSFLMLRDGPTQSGIAYPKYYVWASVKSRGKHVTSGAARVVAINKERFEVANLVSRETILKSPETVRSLFPEALYERICQKATEITPNV